MAEATAKLNVLIQLASKLESGKDVEAYLQKLTGGLLAAGAALAVFAGKQALDAGGAITDLSNAAGMGAQSFQTFTAKGAEMGLAMEDIAKASETLRKGLQSAKENGASPLNRDLAALNLTAVGLQAIAPERQWEAIAGAIAHAGDKQAALNAAANIFGDKNFKKLKEFLEILGADGFDKLFDETKSLRISDEDLKTLDDAGDKLTRIKNALLVIAAKATSGVINAIAAPAAGQAQSNFGVGYMAPLVKEMNDARRPVLGEAAGAAAFADLDKEAAAILEKKKADDAARESREKMNTAEKQARDLEEGLTKGTQESTSAREAANFEAERMLALQKESETVFSSVRQPLELYNEALDRYGLLLRENAISQETFTRAMADAKGKLDAATTIPEAQAAAERELQRISGERAKLDGDFTRTTQEKWSERKKLIADEIAAHQALLATYEKLRDAAPPDSLLRQGYQKSVTSEQGQVAGLQGEQAQFGPSPDSYLQQAQGALARLRESWGTTAEQIGSTISGTIGSAIDSVSGSISGLILGTMSWHDAIANVANTMITTVVQSIVKMFTTWVVQRGVAALASMLWSAKEGAADTAAKAPGAVLSSISSWGVAAAIGVAAIVAAMAAFGGFASGGYTSPLSGAGNPGDVAGFVHKKEWVAPEWMTTSPEFGPTIAGLEAARRGMHGARSGGFLGDIVRSLTAPPTHPERGLKQFWENISHPPGHNYVRKLWPAGATAETQVDQPFYASPTWAPDMEALAAASRGTGSASDLMASSATAGGGGGSVGASASGGKTPVFIMVDERDLEAAIDEYTSLPRYEAKVVRITRRDSGSS